mgnify:CR=1 FL=1
MEDIAKEITRYGIPTRDKTPYWQTTSIQYVLHNEKYAGDSLAQKTYTTRTLPHRKKRNQGEYDQYFVPGSHPAIIDRELFGPGTGTAEAERRGDSPKVRSYISMDRYRHLWTVRFHIQTKKV